MGNACANSDSGADCNSGADNDSRADSSTYVNACSGSGGSQFYSVRNFEQLFFTIQGNLSTSKGTVSYNGLTLTQCLKIESATSIQFTTAKASTLTLVFGSEGTKIKVDGTSYPITNGVATVSLAAGAHTITKDSTANLYYLVVE
ncbi:hypothetical protein ACFTAO_49270 [Paenibacillus rhizoplanae]